MDNELEYERCIYRKQSLGDKHVFDCPRYIEDISQFYSLLSICEEAHKDEVIVLNVFCYGGCLSTTIAVYNALRSTEATVYTINKGVAVSGGSVLLLAGDIIGYSPYSYTMIHTASTGIPCNVLPEVKGQADHSHRRVETFYKDVYSGFVSEEELDTILKGTPLYINDDEHTSRLESLGRYREDAYNNYQNESGEVILDRDSLLKKTKKELVALITGTEEG